MGYSESGNHGRGLGSKFSQALYGNLYSLIPGFGAEKITRGSHLEKLCLIESRVGRDCISDFTTNLIKEYLFAYTEQFASEFLSPADCRRINVNKVRFNYRTESWESAEFLLPFIEGDYVLLTPRDMLTKDETWISQSDLYGQFSLIADALPNEQLRAQVNNYFSQELPKHPTVNERRQVIQRVLRRFPAIIEYYIKSKEDNGDRAVTASDLKVTESTDLYVERLNSFVEVLDTETEFYDVDGDTYIEALRRARYLKDVIENKGGHRIFYRDNEPVRSEKDIQLLYRLTWCGTPSDISREVNDGRGAADFKASRGSLDKSIIEFKLASNSQLKRNLGKQVEIYQAASDAQSSIKVITYFSETELQKLNKILNDLGLQGKENVVVIDARADNKPSASVA